MVTPRDPSAVAETLREMLTAQRGLAFGFTDDECAALETALQAIQIVGRLANLRQGGGYHDCGDVDALMIEAARTLIGSPVPPTAR